MDLKRFDLNLLIAFDALMKERNVTRAAQRLFITQSAMSHNLRKLRDMMGDPLLVPTSGGMRPTQRSLELEGPIRESLMSIQWNLSPPQEFDPQSSEHCFVIGSTDYVEYVILVSGKGRQIYYKFDCKKSSRSYSWLFNALNW